MVSHLSPNKGKKAVRRLYRKDFLAFVVLAFRILHPGKTLKVTWYLRAMVTALQRTATGETRQLAISIAPRTLKSMLVSVFWPAWLLGRDPSLAFVCVSYSNDLSGKHALSFLSLITSPEYMSIFPNVELIKNASQDITTSQHGGRFATSFDGTTTGRGGDYLIIDDPMRPEDARSESQREHIHRVYSTTLINRRNENAESVIIMVGQRVHDDDLIGRHTQGPNWSRLSLAAVAEEDVAIPIGNGKLHRVKAGDLLDPDRLPQSYLDEMIHGMGSAAYAAQYNQNPVPVQGQIFKREWLKSRYAVLPPKEPGDRTTISLDPASKKGLFNDRSAFVIARHTRDRIYLLEVFAARLDFPELISTLHRLCETHRPDTLLIEDSSSGTALIQELNGRHLPYVPRPIPVLATVDKAVRIMSMMPQIERGDLILPAAAPWLADYETELLGFPLVKHDDCVDATAQLLAHVKANTLVNFDSNLIMGKPYSTFEMQGRLPLELQDLSDEFPQQGDFLI